MTDISPIPPPTGEAPTRYPSLPALRAAHGELVQRRRATGDTPEFLTDVRGFIGRGEATGALWREFRLQLEHELPTPSLQAAACRAAVQTFDALGAAFGKVPA